MTIDRLKDYYEQTSHRFWNPAQGIGGRDLVVYELLNGLSGSLLEYGCGAGSLLLQLAKEDRFSKCFGVDISETALSALERAWEQLRHANTGKLMLMTAQDDLLPTIPDKSIDVIVNVATIEHVLNPYVVLDELYRIASDNATLVCCVPNLAYLKLSVGLLFGVQPKTGTDDPVENWRTGGWDGMHLHTFTKSSLSILLKDCGWTPEKWTGWGTRFRWLGIGPLRRRYPGLFSGELVTVCKKQQR